MRPILGSLSLILVVAACGAPSARPVSPSGQRASGPSTFVGVCVGARGALLFAADDTRRVRARATADGSIRWEAPAQGQVVHCDDRVVVVASIGEGTLRAQVLDATSGRVRLEAPAVALPEWAGAGDTTVVGWGEPDGIGIAWHAFTSWRGGYPPSPEEEAAARHETEGAFVLLTDGRTRPVAGAPTWEGREQAGDGAPGASWQSMGAAARRGIGGGASVVVEVGEERDDDRGSFLVITARAVDGGGAEIWAAEILRTPWIEDVP